MVHYLHTGCVEVAGCLTSEELVNWEAVPASVNYYTISLLILYAMSCIYDCCVVVLIKVYIT